MTDQNHYSIYLIAGEPSGDLLGGRLMAAIKHQAGEDNPITFHGIGGEKMMEQGLTSLFPMAELSIMGVAEIVPKLPKLISRLRQTVTDIKARRPDMVITIDAPDFCFRIAAKLQNQGISLLHMVAPSVWAWREGRAQKTARLFDHLFTLLPFEPPYFEKYGLETTFTGHPVIEGGADQGEGQGFRRKYKISNPQKLIAVLPGSRQGEIKRLLPVFKDSIKTLSSRYPDLVSVMPIAPGRKDLLAPFIHDWPTKLITTENDREKFDAFAASDAALAASGTVSLELAMAKTPSLIAYKMNPVTFWLAKKMIRVRYANLVNILLDKPAIPEFLQDQCTSENLSLAMTELLSDKDLQIEQIKNYDRALTFLGQGDNPPSTRAARQVLSILQKKGRP